LSKRVLISLVLLWTWTAAAQEKPVTIGGHAFLDAYAVVSHHDESIEGASGFWLRRAYVFFDKAFSESVSVRLAFEANSPGDFKTSANIEPFLKDVWVRWKQSPRLELVAGMSPTPLYPTVERVWGYRAVERTPLDLQRMGSSRDLGVAALGRLGRVQYHVMAGNGSGTGAETNEGKRIGGSVLIPLTATTLVEFSGDREDRAGDDDRSTAQVFAAVQRERFRAGVQYAHQSRAASNIDVLSAFGVVYLRTNVSVLARVDRLFDPNPEGDRISYLPFAPDSESTLVIAGVDWKVHKNVSVIPNVQMIRYDSGIDSDIHSRLTLALTF
jgi:hypothetical protein